MVGGYSGEDGEDLALSAWDLASSQHTSPVLADGCDQSSDQYDGADHDEGSGASCASTRLAAATVRQLGAIPPSRVGHSAVVSPKSTIILFGGESATSGGRGAKLSDMFEGTPRDSSGTLTWRDIHVPAKEKGEASAAPGAGTGVAPTEPGALAFHASCSALFQGKWVMLVHGGVDERSVVRGDLWALRLTWPRGADCGSSTRWVHLTPQGEG